MQKLSANERIQLWNDKQLFGGMDILKARCKDYYYSPHTHDVFVIAAFREGEQKHRIVKERGIAYPGTVMVIPPGDVHSGEGAKRDTAWEYSAFYPSSKCLDLLAGCLFGNDRGCLDFGTTYLIEDRELAGKLLQASDTAKHSDKIAQRQEAVYGAFELLVRRYGRRTRSGDIRPLLGAPIQKGLEYMRDNLNENLKLGDIAKEAGLSEFHFMRVFKARMNVTVHQYLTQFRLENAKALLAEGIPIATIATNVGFYDQSHLARSFRRAFGITPNQYAKACR